jgi:hypothetical protein
VIRDAAAEVIIMYIACPKCDWRPDPDEEWTCTCGHVWHVFATHGICPACGKVWEDTQCNACHQWSDHEDWYHEDDDLTVADYIENPERARG